MTKRKTLWMRFVSFEIVKKMLHLVYEHNGKLRAGELERLGIKKRVLIKKDGTKPLARTSRYHYRKAMENLGLVKVKQKRYCVSKDKRVLEFLKLTDFDNPMSEDAKEILRDIIVENDDCKNYFFDLFMGESFYTLEELRKKGDHVQVETKSMRDSLKEKWIVKEENKRYDFKKKKVGPIILKNSNGKTIELKTQDEIHAIYWGVRLWALELGITNEIMTSFSEGRIIYPVNQNFSKKMLTEKIADKIEMNKSNSDWTLIHIPTFIKEVALSTRFSIDKIKGFLLEVKKRYPSSVMFIPSSTAFIDIRTPFEKQDSAIRNLYLYRQGKGYLSHMRIKNHSQGDISMNNILNEEYKLSISSDEVCGKN